MSTEKSKIIISEEEFQTKLVSCTGSAIKSALLGSIATGVTISLILGKLKFLRRHAETKVLVGTLSSLTGGYYMALYARTNCLEQVEDDYTY